MASPSLCLMACSNLAPEVAAAAKAEGLNVQVVAFPAICRRTLRNSWTKVEAFVAEHADASAPLCLIGGSCLAEAETQPRLPESATLYRLDQCSALLIGPDTTARYLRQGAYLLTPGWLARWREYVDDWGFDQATAREFFSESIRRLVLLDSGLAANSAEHLQAFADYVGLPSEQVPVGVDYTRLFLAKLVLEQRVQRAEKQPALALTEASRQVADYAMAFDLLGQLAQVIPEAQVVDNILQLFAAISAPSQMVYVPWISGGPGLFQARPPLAELPASLTAALANLTADYAWTDAQTGFILPIRRQAETLGFLFLERFAFPEYKTYYLNLALAVLKVLALALANAREYEALTRAQEDIRQLNTHLERRVDERTGELSEANAALTRALHVKDEFLAMMGHELRTPLTAVLGLSEALQLQVYGPLTEKQLKSLQTIHSSGQHLLDLLSEVLEYSNLEAGQLRPELEPVDVEQVCQASLRSIQTNRQQKKLHVTVMRDTRVDCVQADGRRLKQMLNCLLNNAVKFTPEAGAIGLEVEGDSAQQAVRFIVWDTGIGIAPENQVRVFEPFVQIDARLARDYEGAGLGLALVRRWAQLQGGAVSLTSAGLPGQGSRFTISLPWKGTPLG
jgi:signal transduction histidine kinase